MKSVLLRLVADRMQKMCLAQPHAAIEKEWVELLARLICHRHRRSMGQSVVIADHKRIKRMMSIQLASSSLLQAASQPRLVVGSASRSGDETTIFLPRARKFAHTFDAVRADCPHPVTSFLRFGIGSLRPH